MALPEADCCLAFSTRITSPGATRYCFPPARMTAYIVPPTDNGLRIQPAAQKARQPPDGSRTAAKPNYFSVLAGGASNSRTRASAPRKHLPSSFMLELGTPVQYVKGVGPRIAEMLAAKFIQTLEDLLFYLPFRYEDRLNPRTIAELRAGEMASVIAEVRTSFLFRTRNRMPLL